MGTENLLKHIRESLTGTDKILVDYHDAIIRGEKPSKESYLAVCGEEERGEMELYLRMIDQMFENEKVGRPLLSGVQDPENGFTYPLDEVHKVLDGQPQMTQEDITQFWQPSSVCKRCNWYEAKCAGQKGKYLTWQCPRILQDDGEMACKVCGCTKYRACIGGCWWVEPELCSECG